MRTINIKRPARITNSADKPENFEFIAVTVISEEKIKGPRNKFLISSLSLLFDGSKFRL